MEHTPHRSTGEPREQEERSILINFVLDKSGSMDVIREATISGFNEFLGDQQREGGDARMTLTLFDTRFRTVVEAAPIAEVTPLDVESYRPHGMTALYDAIAHTMRVTDDYYAVHRPDQVLFVIMTDGLENSSRVYDRSRIMEMIEDRKRLAGYEFIYLGANQDSYAVSGAMGIDAHKSLDFQATPEAARVAMKRLSDNVRAYRRSGEERMQDQFFSYTFENMGAVEYDQHKAGREAPGA